MSQAQGWKVLKTVAAFTDEDDYAALQTAPPDDEIAIVSYEQPASARPSGIGGVSGVALAIEWLDADGVVIADRGSFDLQAIWIAQREGVTPAGDCILDSAKVAGIGYRPILIDFRGGVAEHTKLGARLTNITEGTGAASFRVLWREL